MGLRDYLASLQLGAQGAASGNEALAGMEKQNQLRQLAAQAPGLLNQPGGAEQVAAQAAQAGDMSLMRELFQQKATQATKPSPFNAATLITQGVPADKAQLLEGLSYDQQKEAINNIQSTAASKQSAYQFGETKKQQEKLFNAKTEIGVGNKLGGISDKAAKIEKEIVDGTAGLQTALKNFSEKATPAAANMLTRAILKGLGDSRISDQDIAGLSLVGLPNKSSELMNYLLGEQGQTLTAPQIKELQRAAQSAITGADARKQQMMAQHYSTSFNLNTALALDSDGKVRPQVAKTLGKAGLTVIAGPDGDTVEIIVGEPKTAPANAINKETGAPDIEVLAQQVELISDPKAKASAKKALATYQKPGGVVNSDKLKGFAAQLQTYIKK